MINLLNIFNKAKAFTLAEVLITLGIIGVVAAITVPTLMTKMQDIRNATILKEDYSILQQVMKRSFDDGATSSLGGGNNITLMKQWFDTFMQPYMTVANVCFDEKGCWAEQKTKYLNNGNWPDANLSGAGKGIGQKPICFVMSNGSNVCLDDYTKDQLLNTFGVNLISEESFGMAIYIDVNGSKQPNILGKDTFVAVALGDQFVPAGNSLSRTEIDKDCSKTGRGFYCLWKIKNNGWSMLKFK